MNFECVCKPSANAVILIPRASSGPEIHVLNKIPDDTDAWALQAALRAARGPAMVLHLGEEGKPLFL